MSEAIEWLPWGWNRNDLGCVYALALSDDHIKVGATKSPLYRLKAHRSLLWRDLKVEIAGVFYSSPHLNYTQSEGRVHTVLGRKSNRGGFPVEVYPGLSLSYVIDRILECDMVGLGLEDA